MKIINFRKSGVRRFGGSGVRDNCVRVGECCCLNFEVREDVR